MQSRQVQNVGTDAEPLQVENLGTHAKQIPVQNVGTHAKHIQEQTPRHRNMEAVQASFATIVEGT